MKASETEESGYVYNVCCVNKTLLIIISKDLLIVVVAQFAIVGNGFFSLPLRYTCACVLSHVYAFLLQNQEQMKKEISKICFHFRNVYKQWRE